MFLLTLLKLSLCCSGARRRSVVASHAKLAVRPVGSGLLRDRVAVSDQATQEPHAQARLRRLHHSRQQRIHLDFAARQ